MFAPSKDDDVSVQLTAGHSTSEQTTQMTGTKKCVSVVLLTGVQALGDRGWFDQVTSTQVTGDEMVKVSNQVLPSSSSHV